MRDSVSEQSKVQNPKFKVCLIDGDGVGKEVIPAAAEVLAALGLGIEFIEARAGFEFFKQSGDAIPDATLAAVEGCDVALFGATSSPSTKGGRLSQSNLGDAEGVRFVRQCATCAIAAGELFTASYRSLDCAREH
jgi:isocitrate dehydrogenase